MLALSVSSNFILKKVTVNVILVLIAARAVEEEGRHGPVLNTWGGGKGQSGQVQESQCNERLKLVDKGQGIGKSIPL